MPSKEELILAARLVHAGIVPKEKAEAVLKERESLREQLVPPTLLDLLVKRGLITRTELMIFRDRPLEELQPFPDYVIQGKVAEGGMAQVYRATYTPLEVDVVLKVVKPEVSRQERFLLRFRREAGLLMKLEHPAIVRGYDLAEQERVWYCAMEFAEGCDLQALVEKHGPLKEDDALHVVIQMARAVAYLDGRGIVHRDLKPSNVVVDTKGDCKIIDLGLCMLRAGMKEDTGAGTTVGTVEYLSPEQARGLTDLDVRSDLYALGITIHHLMTGVVPFLGETPEETLLKQVLGVFKTQKLEKVGASAKLIDLVTRLLEKEREERIPTAQVLIEEMEAKWPSLRPPAPAPLTAAARSLRARPPQARLEEGAGKGEAVSEEEGDCPREKGGPSAKETSKGTVPGFDVAFSDLRALYADFDRETAAVSPVCRASGRCCDFDVWGHTLFASRLEVDLLLAESGLRSFDPATRLCPFWKERKCTARSPRPLGCRAFFCDEAKTEAMGELHERFLSRLKGIHDRHGIPWRYAPLLSHIADALPREG